jgi:GntR family transcriptional regulator/MocR family aminotransferase
MNQPLKLELDRSAKTPLAEQIRRGISTAIETGVLAPGARLPSWLDLAAQLGVARGTVKTAYEKLSAAQLIVASRAAGTHVADRPISMARAEQPPDPGSFLETYLEMTAGPAIFQMGVPAQGTFPATLLARIRSQAVRAESIAPAIYPDPRGELELRREIAAYLAVARGIACLPSQILITAGYNSGLGLALHVLGLAGRKVWMEEPGSPLLGAAWNSPDCRSSPSLSIWMESTSIMVSAMLRMPGWSLSRRANRRPSGPPCRWRGGYAYSTGRRGTRPGSSKTIT